MRSLSMFAALTVALVFAIPSFADSIFDGKTTNGWTTKNPKGGKWAVGKAELDSAHPEKFSFKAGPGDLVDVGEVPGRLESFNDRRGLPDLAFHPRFVVHGSDCCLELIRAERTCGEGRLHERHTVSDELTIPPGAVLIGQRNECSGTSDSRVTTGVGEQHQCE